MAPSMCQWAGCSHATETPKALHSHVIDKHVVGERDQRLANQAPRWQCSWGDCRKYFTCKLSLTAHVSSHTNYRPIACDICDKSFASMGGYNTHMLLHDEPKLPCPHDGCSRVFHQPGTLRYHLMSHIPIEGRRQHECNLCGKRYTRPADVVRHKREVHAEKHKCPRDGCPRAFRSRTAYSKHIQTCRGRRPKPPPCPPRRRKTVPRTPQATTPAAPTKNLPTIHVGGTTLAEEEATLAPVEIGQGMLSLEGMGVTEAVDDPLGRCVDLDFGAFFPVPDSLWELPC